MGYCAFLTISLYMHNTMVLLPVLLGAAVVMLWVGTGLLTRRFLVAWALSTLVAVALYCPWLAVVVDQIHQHGPASWIPPPTNLKAIYGEIAGVYPFPAWSKPVMYIVLPMGGMWTLRRTPWVVGLLLTFLIGQPLLTLLLTYLVTPIYMVRALLWPAPLYYVLIGAAVAALRRPWQVAVVLLFVAVVQLVALAPLYPAGRVRPDSGDVVQLLTEQGHETDAILIGLPGYAMAVQNEAQERGGVPGTRFYTN